MASVSSGIVTILFTDLVGHSGLYQRMGQAEALNLIASHFGVIREAVSRHGGREVKPLFEGDSLMVAFPTASSALRAAVEIQQAVAERNMADPQVSLSIRIGLNTGEPVVDRDDLFGTAVIVAKRLCDQAQGGQVLASEAVYALVRLQGEFGFTDQGLKDLKGIAEPVRAYDVRWEEKQVASVPRTILITDILGSTALTRKLGAQRWRQLRQSHNAIVREQVSAHGGVVVKSLGDGFMIAFQSAVRAVHCAVALQRALAAHSEREFEGRCRVRMGLATGEVTQEEGESVILAVLICGRCPPGEILVSSGLKELTESAEGIRFGEKRRMRLKALGMQTAFEVAWEQA
jgi:class 3 adenylate cyclase